MPKSRSPRRNGRRSGAIKRKPPPGATDPAPSRPARHRGPVNRRARERRHVLEAMMNRLLVMAYRYRHGHTGVLEFVSAGCRALTGYGPEEFIDRRIDFTRLVHPDDRERIWQQFQAALAARKPYELFYRITTKTGLQKHVWHQGHGIFAADGALLAREGCIADNSARHRAEEALRASEARIAKTARELGRILDNLQDAYYRTDLDGRLTRVSPSVRDLFGYEPHEVIGRHLAEFYVEPDGRARFLAALEAAGGDLRGYETALRHKNGAVVWVATHSRIVHDDSGKPIGVEGIARDITQQRATRVQMHKLSSAVQQTTDNVMITDADGVIEYINPAFERITGYTHAEAVGRKPSLLKSGRHETEFYRRVWDTLLAGEPFRDVFINRRKDGGLYYEDQAITPLKDGDGRVTHFIATGRDITDRIRTEERLEHLAHHDAVTGLPNRILFMDRLQRALVRAQRYERLVAVMFMDLDGFKAINDGHGHAAGDELLRALSLRLNECMRQGDTLSRLGGDEFAILVEDIAQREHVLPVAGKILNAVALPYALADRECRVTTSMGISLYPLDGQDPQSLLRNADDAMYRAKERGKNNFQFYSPPADA